MKRPSRSECRHGSGAASEMSPRLEAEARALWPEVLTKWIKGKTDSGCSRRVLSLQRHTVGRSR